MKRLLILLLSLILLPVFLVIGLIKGIFGGALEAKKLKYIPIIIEQLSTTPLNQDVAFKKIKFPQVLAYAEELGTITHKRSDFFEFFVKINNRDFSVKVSRAIDGSNYAIFNKVKIRAKTEAQSKTTRITPIHEARKKDHSTLNTIDKLDAAYERHKLNCRW